MRGRDLGVAVVAVAAAFLALQGTPDVDVQLRWIMMERSPEGKGRRKPENVVPVPLPLVTDLDGDGKNEVVLLVDGGTKLRVLSVPLAFGETLVDPLIKLETEAAPKTTKFQADKRVVAMAAGYLDHPPEDGSARHQHLVIVREDWHVICYDHTLDRLWKKDLYLDGSTTDGGSYIVDQVAIAMAGFGTEEHNHAEGDSVNSGIVVVGGSMRHHAGQHYHSRGSKSVPAASGSRSDSVEDPLGVHVEAFVSGEVDSRDETEEAAMSEEEKKRRAAEHFSFFGLNRKGQPYWRHEAQVAKEKIARPEDSAAPNRPQYKLPELDDLSATDEGDLLHSYTHGDTTDSDAQHGGGPVGRRYQTSLLQHLPHAWSSAVDTRLDIAILRRKGSSKSRSNDNEKVRVGGHGGGVSAETGLGGGAVLAVVAHTRDGLEAVSLAKGKPLSVVSMPASAAGAGVYADLNGDTVVDHVQAVGTRGGHGWGHLHSGLAMGHLSEAESPSQADKARTLPPCYALAVSGLPPREQLFNGSLCHDAGALLNIQERLSSRKTSRSRREPRSPNIEVGAASPAVLPQHSTDTHRGTATGSKTSNKRKNPAQTDSETTARRSDVVFAVSNGVVSSYNDEGRLKWQNRHGPKWATTGIAGEKLSGYVVPFHLDSASAASKDGDPSDQYVLVTGQDKLCIFDRAGRMVGSTRLALVPSQRPVLGDFDGDGVTDIVIIGGQQGGVSAGYSLGPDPGIRALFVLVLAFVGAMLVVAAVYVPPPAGSSTGRGGVSWRRGEPRGRPGTKSKRSTD